jgi:hypothetical protein
MTYDDLLAGYTGMIVLMYLIGLLGLLLQTRHETITRLRDHKRRQRMFRSRD